MHLHHNIYNECRSPDTYRARVDLPLGAATKLETTKLSPVIDQLGVMLVHFFNCNRQSQDSEGLLAILCAPQEFASCKS